jgi:hypothetical protein
VSKDLVRTKKDTVSFQDRVREALSNTIPQAHAFQGAPDTSALLLDISGSMKDPLPPNTSKIEELRKLAEKFKDVRRFQFSWDCEELKAGESVGEARGGTSMSLAFDTVKEKGIKHVVLITDGLPDSPANALQSAKGLRIDVFYVGPDPAPQFLRDLANITGGRYGKATLEARAALEGKVRALLPAPGGKAVCL